MKTQKPTWPVYSQLDHTLEYGVCCDAWLQNLESNLEEI